MDIMGATYKVSFDPDTVTVTFYGVMRLQKAGESESIAHLLNTVAEQVSTTITLDLRSMELINSAGVSVLIKFMKKVRERNASQVIIKGNKKFFWQRDILVALTNLSPQHCTLIMH
jgi:hypothetical protein